MAFDACGVTVPERLREVFEDRTELLSICQKLEELQREVYLLSDGCGAKAIDMVLVRDLLAHARREIRSNTPFSVCDCHAFRDCEQCGGKRWRTVQEQLQESVL